VVDLGDNIDTTSVPAQVSYSERTASRGTRGTAVRARSRAEKGRGRVMGSAADRTATVPPTGTSLSSTVTAPSSAYMVHHFDANIDATISHSSSISLSNSLHVSSTGHPNRYNYSAIGVQPCMEPTPTDAETELHKGPGRLLKRRRNPSLCTSWDEDDEKLLSMDIA
jgi:hypothetical protein